MELNVAPHAGAWIETHQQVLDIIREAVAPHAGAWIETGAAAAGLDTGMRRTPRGCVD